MLERNIAALETVLADDDLAPDERAKIDDLLDGLRASFDSYWAIGVGVDPV
jgi:hypothetical protein